MANVLHTATENAIPNHKANDNRNSKKRGRVPWNEEIGQASRRSKDAFHRWKMDGSPKETGDALYKEMKESKKILRQKQRQAAARIRENKYNDIMESADFNQQLFYKLIREQRTTRSDETDTIVIDDMVLNEDECILNGWNTHFQRLSTPDPGMENTEDPSAMECTLIEEILKDPIKRKEIPEITTTTAEEAIQKLAKWKAPDHMGLTAEHFKKGGQTIVSYTAALLNAAK